jgi:hypothetical protein
MLVELVLRGRGIEEAVKPIFLSMNLEQVISAWFSGVTIWCGTSEVYWRMHKLSTLLALGGPVYPSQERVLVMLHEY